MFTIFFFFLSRENIIKTLCFMKLLLIILLRGELVVCAYRSYCTCNIITVPLDIGRYVRPSKRRAPPSMLCLLLFIKNTLLFLSRKSTVRKICILLNVCSGCSGCTASFTVLKLTNDTQTKLIFCFSTIKLRVANHRN